MSTRIPQDGRGGPPKSRRATTSSRLRRRDMPSMGEVGERAIGRHHERTDLSNCELNGVLGDLLR